MGETPRCPHCGGPLGEGWGEDLCPHCVLRMALEESSEGGTDPEVRAATAAVDNGSKALTRGRILGNRYGIRKFLGRGGMGEVWQAFDLKLRVEMALKTVRSELAEKPQVLETLRQEVRAARDVLSPNVCRVYDLQELDGRELVSMEYVDGTTLLQLLEERGPVELQEAREIATQFLAGLDAIHQAGLVHRDIKPENLMITRTGRVVVMDFGIAKGLAAGRSGTVAGTPAYMSPEQARGESVDARADVFSAGVVLAEMLAPVGEKAEREALWRGIRQEPPLLPESPWREVIEVAVAQRREQRYAAASVLARALEEVAIRVDGAEDVLPYPGLAAFSQANQEYFFGRELEAEALWKRIRKLHLLALIGPSGAGKTSFLRAGLLASAPSGWAHVILTPGEAPVTALRQALAPLLSGDSDAIRELVKVEDPEAMVSAVSRWRQRSKHALLVVDQLEELFTLNPPEVQASFATLLGRLAVDADLRVLLSMRDDFLIHCHGHEALKPILSELTLLGPPTGAALRRAVVQPALKCGYRFEDEALVDRMLAEVEGERAALPLIAFAAEQLWQRRDRKQGVLTGEAYELIGGVSGALAQHAEQTLERIGTDKTPMVRELFRNLVTAEGTRGVRAREELLSVFRAGADRKAAGEILDALIDARLLTSYAVEAAEGIEERQQRIEIVHESLLSAWPRLVRWQAQDVEGARMRDDLRQAARRWQERDRPDDVLWTGSAYREFQVWRERYPGRLSEIEEAFTIAMARRAARQRRRRRVVATSVFAVLTAVTVAMGVLWKRAQAEALRAEAGKLLALGRAHLEADPTAALAYTRGSLELHDAPDARRFAQEVLWHGPVARILPLEQMIRDAGLPENTSALRDVAFSPDGRWLAELTGDNRRLVLFDRKGGPPRPLPRQPDGKAMVVAFEPQSDLLVTGGTGHSLRLWSLPDLREIRTVELDGVHSYGLGVAGNTLFVQTHVREDANGAGVIQALDLPDGEPRTVGEFLPGEAFLTNQPGGLDAAGRWLFYILPQEWGIRSIDGSRRRVLARGRRGWVDVTFSPGGDRLVTTDPLSGEVQVLPIDGAAADPLRVLQGPAGGAWFSHFDPAGRRFAQSGPHNTIHLWDLEEFPDARPLVFGRPGANSIYVRFDPTRPWLAKTAGGPTLDFHPLSTPYRRVLADTLFPGGATVDFTGDGRWMATCGWRSLVHFWPVSAADESARDLKPRLPCQHLATHPAGGDILLGIRGAVVLFPQEGSPRGLFRRPEWGATGGATGDFGPLAFDTRGRRAVAGRGRGYRGDPLANHIWEWDLSSGRERVHSIAHLIGPDWLGFSRMQFAPDGRLYATGPGGVQRLVLPTEPEGTVSGEMVYAAANASSFLSRDGRWLLVAASPELRGSFPVLPFEELILLDLEREESRRITTHGDRLSAVCLSPSGRVVVTGDPDGLVRVGPASGEEPHLLFGHTSRVSHVAVSPDERWIASVSKDSLSVWPMPDVTKPPLHTLPHEELLAKLDTLTNLRVVRDAESSTGWALDVGPFPGWDDVPTW